MGNHQGLGGTSMSTHEHLQKIKVKCQELLAIAEKRTAGEWRLFDVDDGCPGIESGETSIVIWGEEDDEAGVRTGFNDATFIALCAGAAEAGWKSTIATIDALQDLANQCDYFSDGSPDASPRDKFANELEGMIDYAINQIIAAWPQELL
jgi:hypothetical protein